MALNQPCTRGLARRVWNSNLQRTKAWTDCPPPYAPGTSLRWADAGGWDGAPRPPNQQSSVLTGTGVGSEDPGQGAHRPRVPALPQALQLGELAGRTDESTEILFADKTGES